jgi:hypothetical protein
MPPQIAIFHVNTVPSQAFDEFRRITASPEVDVQVVAVDPPGPMAAIEWLMPTVVIGFVASAYFGGFFQEMGKEHYLLVKERFKRLYPEVAGPDSPDVKLIGSGGKVREVQPYSLYFSLVGEGPNGIRIKLLLKRPIPQTEYDHCVEVFLDLLRDLNSAKLSESSQRRFQAVTPIGRTILVVLDEETDEIVPIDPRTGELAR